MNDLDNSPFSFHFNFLRIIGAWDVRTKNRKLARLYLIYKTFMTVLAISGCLSLCVDFYLVMGDFKKLTWNICVTTLFCGGFIKNVICFHKYRQINQVRVDLHKDSMSGNSPEDQTINASAVRELKLLRVSFYGTCAIFIPVWLATRHISYLWGPREPPLPLRIPIDYDPEDVLQYNLVFVVFAAGGLTGITLVVESEIAMFGMLIQISREYARLLKDIPKLNDLYEGDHFQNEAPVLVQEVNPLLRNKKTRSLIKEFSSRQQKLIDYTKNFEIFYNQPMILQVFVASLIFIASSIQVSMLSGRFSVLISYQLGYNFLLFVDMFCVCYMATRIREQCIQVGERMYFTLWYRMGLNIQKDICMIITRSQRPPKITAAKVMEMNLHAFMILFRNIYSWLALYKQFEAKVANF